MTAMKASDTSRTRGLRSWSITRRVLTATIILGLLGATLAMPAGATSQQPAGTANPSGMAAALQSIIGPAPATFPQQLKSYLQNVATSKSYAGLPGAAGLSAKAATAATLLTKADAHDLSVLYYVLSQVPKWQQGPARLLTAAREYRATTAWQRNVKLHPNTIGTDCPDSNAHIAEVIVADAASQIFELVDLQVADSDLVTVLGEGVTIPVSPYKIITQVIKEVFNIAYEALYGTYNVLNDCTEREHEQQTDQTNQYVLKMVQQKTLTVHVTAIDTYHYQLTVPLQGQTVDPTNQTVQTQYTQTGCTIIHT